MAGDVTDPDDVARLAEGHDAVASALGPSEDEDVDVVPELANGLIEGLRQAGVDRLIWTGGAGTLNVGPDTKLVETDEFPEEFIPLVEAHDEAFQQFRDVEDIDWSYIAPPAVIEPGERTGEYRTAEEQLVADEDGESHISMEDFAVAFVDELESGDAIHTQLGVEY